MESKKNRFNIILVYIAILALVTTSFSMARYMNLYKGTITADTAKFTININEAASNSFQIKLSDTAKINSNYNQDLDVIVPGSKGSFVLELDASQMQTAFNYKIKLSANQNANIPEELIFYDTQRENMDILNTQNLDGTWPNEKIKTEDIELSDLEVNNKITYTVDWLWQINKDKNESNYEGTDFYIDIEIQTKQIY